MIIKIKITDHKWIPSAEVIRDVLSLNGYLIPDIQMVELKEELNTLRSEKPMDELRNSVKMKIIIYGKDNPELEEYIGDIVIVRNRHDTTGTIIIFSAKPNYY
jgi:hypothetical protein